MSNEKKDAVMDALSGGAPQGVDQTDWKAKYEEAQRELNSARVDQGRVKKLSEENQRLKHQLEERTTRRPSDYLDDEERQAIDEDQRGIIDKMVDGRVSDAVKASREDLEALKASIERQNAERDAREAATRKRELELRFEREFPGLGAQLGPGGDKHDAWMNYRRFVGASIDLALANSDFDALAWHVRKFFTDELGLPPPSGGEAPAAPEPGSIGGGKPFQTNTGKTYTAQEYAELEKEAMRLRRIGDYDGYRKLDEELNNILTEGRVKD